MLQDQAIDDFFCWFLDSPFLGPLIENLQVMALTLRDSFGFVN
jgi:hypothetical protein